MKKKKSLLLKDIRLVGKRASIKNFKKGFDEEKIYGPILIFLLVILFILFFMKIISLTVLVVGVFVIFFNFFVYFPFHKAIVCLISLILTLASLIISGFFLMFYGKVTFSDIALISYLWWISIAIALLLESLACRNYKLEEVDIFLGYCNKKLGSWVVYLLVPLSSIVFLAFASTYFLFGEQHLYLWAIVFVFWIISGIRIIKYKILNHV